MNCTRRPQTGFTLVELLVSISVLVILLSLLAPSLGAARESGRSAVCLSNLHQAALGMGQYLSQNRQRFWPYMLPNTPRPGVKCYFWGTDSDPVDPSASPFLRHLESKLDCLWCPSLAWGSYVPQGAHVSQPTTTYGYNGRYLDPGLVGRNGRNACSIPRPSLLFVLGDAGMAWAPAGVMIFQNSTYLEPVCGSWVQTPTNHFRHNGLTNALCADGRVERFTSEGWIVDSVHNLGFVGTKNDPHYEQ